MKSVHISRTTELRNSLFSYHIWVSPVARAGKLGVVEGHFRVAIHDALDTVPRILDVHVIPP